MPLRNVRNAAILAGIREGSEPTDLQISALERD